MSAFVHAPAHVLAIVAAAHAANLGTVTFRRQSFDLSDVDQCLALAALLYRANVRSVNYRYDERGRTPLRSLTRATFDARVANPLTMHALCKAIDSLDYQSCERLDYRNSTPAKLLNQLRDKAEVRAVGRYRKPLTQPDYDKVSQTAEYSAADVWCIS